MYSLGVGLRPAFAHGLVPIRIGGVDLHSGHYPIQAPNYLNVRLDVEEARSVAEGILGHLQGMYHEDLAALKRLGG